MYDWKTDRTLALLSDISDQIDAVQAAASQVAPSWDEVFVECKYLVTLVQQGQTWLLPVPDDETDRLLTSALTTLVIGGLECSSGAIARIGSVLDAALRTIDNGNVQFSEALGAALEAMKAA